MTTNINAESDAVRERAAQAAADPQHADSVAAYHATNEQGNFALWNNVFDAAREISVPVKFGPPRPVGRPRAGRTANLMVRVKPEAKAAFERHAKREEISLVEAVEEGARLLKRGRTT